LPAPWNYARFWCGGQAARPELRRFNDGSFCSKSLIFVELAGVQMPADFL
jgi:hypothetical protein